MLKVLVTGGAGFIGSHTVCELEAAGIAPVIADNFSNSDNRVIDGLKKITEHEPKVYRIDCTDAVVMRQMFSAENFDAVIHFAAFKAVGESVEQPVKYYRNNIGSMIVVLEMMKEFDVKHLVFSSSCTVYGEPDELPVTENSPLKTPNSPYGFTKQACEQLVRDFVAAEKKFSAALLRYFNPVGAHPSGHNGELPFGVPNNLVPFIVQTAAGVRDELVVFGHDYNTGDGTCVRDYIHVIDLALAHVKALDWLTHQPGKCEAFNLGCGSGHSVQEVIRAFENITGIKLNYKFGERRHGDVERIWADPSKANSELKWKSKLTLEDALRDAWRWQQHLASIEEVKS